MSSGRPDYHPTMLLEGKHGAELIPVLVDANGQLYIVMTGQAITVTDVLAMTDKDRDIRGLDGVTKRAVAVDAAGVILARMKGYDGANLQDVKVDTLGYMLAKMTGLDGATLRTVAVDADGVMKANLSVQSLDFLRVRPVYGQTRKNTGSKAVDSGVGAVELFTVSGKGAILGGFVYWLAGTSSGASIRLFIDGVETINVTPNYLDAHNMIEGFSFPLVLSGYDQVTPQYQMSLRPGSTFESSFALYASQATGAAVTFYWIVPYALVPA